ncbi:hypothetical protein LINGRAHAP2_LOCUS35308 [Linum grandiflorum]
MVASRSFAEVARERSLPHRGKCQRRRLKGEDVIEVSEEGVKERLLFLQHCLVLRFVTREVFDWSVFRQWARQQWGIAYDSTFTSIGDDLWLLVCPSADEVQRILHLNRCRFKNIDIQMDVWIEDAGRSSVMSKLEVAWIRVRGIPLHLRSKDLYRCIGDFCGGFICSEEGVDFTFVRIKIKASDVIPEEVLLSSSSKIFPVRVELETPRPLAASGAVDNFFKGWKGKGSGCRVSIPSPQLFIAPSTACSSGQGLAQSLSPLPEPLMDKEGDGTGGKASAFELGCDNDGLPDDVQTERDEIGLSTTNCTGTALVRDSDSDSDELLRNSGNFVGLKVNSLDQFSLVTVARNWSHMGFKEVGSGLVSYSAQKAFNIDFSDERICVTFCGKEWASIYVEYFGPLDMYLPKRVFKLSIPTSLSTATRMLSSLDLNRSAGLSLKTLTDTEVRREGSEKTGVESIEVVVGEDVRVHDFLDSECSTVQLVEEVIRYTPALPLEFGGEDELSLEAKDAADLIVQATRDVAGVIGMRLNGSLDEGIEEAGLVAKDFCRRKQKATPKSRTDRELRRLGVSSDGVLETVTVGRRERCAPASFSLNES